MARIQFINTDLIDPSLGTEVEVHSPTCQHVAKYRTIPLFDAMGDAGEATVETAQEAFEEYNADFLAEGGQTVAWNVTVFPCSALTDKKVTLTSDNH